MSCHVKSWHGKSCHVMSCQVKSCQVMSCHVMSSHYGHQVVVVDELDEGLHLHPLLPGLLRGALGHLPGVLGEPNHEGVSVWPGVGAIVVVSDYDGLLAGVPSGQEDDDLVVLEELHHCARVSTLVSPM